MIRLLRINGQDVDLDSSTAIGINLQAYDLKNPGSRITSASNSFTVPATAKNRAIFGYAADPQSRSTVIYDETICDYWIDAFQIITSAKCKVESISDRISLFVFEKPDVWDLTKQVSWEQFQQDFLQWIQDEKGIPSEASPFTGTYNEFVAGYIGNDAYLKFGHYFGNLYNYIPPAEIDYLEDVDNLYLNYFDESALGGHMCAYWRHIFEYVEQAYGVNFLTAGGQSVGNVWDDEFASAVYTPLRNIAPAITLTGGGDYESVHFEYVEAVPILHIGIFYPYEDVRDKEDQTLYDCLNTFFTAFQILIDTEVVDDEKAYKLSRFDDLEDTAEVVHFGGVDPEPAIFKPYIDGYAQENYIEYKEVYPEGGKTVGRRVLTCANKNLDANKDLFEHNAYFPAVVGDVLDLSTEESFKTFEVLIDADYGREININYQTQSFGGILFQAFQEVPLTAVYSLGSEYNLMDQVLDAPRWYEVGKWLSIVDVSKLQFFKLYFIPELGGSFFINKVSGFNPMLSNAATKLELIKITDRTPVTPPDLNYWMDGVEDPFTDGIGDIFY